MQTNITAGHFSLWALVYLQSAVLWKCSLWYFEINETKAEAEVFYVLCLYENNETMYPISHRVKFLI